MSPKRAARRDKFKKLGQAISALKPPKIGDPDVNDYTTGKPSKFHMVHGDTFNRELHEIPFGPECKTPQWVRTVS